jgi:hypothetical protein
MELLPATEQEAQRDADFPQQETWEEEIDGRNR